MIEKFTALAANSFMKIQFQNSIKRKGLTAITRGKPLMWLEPLLRLAHEGGWKEIGELAAVGAENSCLSLHHRSATARAVKCAALPLSLHGFVVALLILLEEVEKLRHLRLGKIALLEHRPHLHLQLLARGGRRERVAPVGRELDVRIPPHANERSTWSFATHTVLLSGTGISSHETIPWQVIKTTKCQTKCQTKTETRLSFCSEFFLKNFSFLLLQNMVRADVFTGSLAVFRFAAKPLIFAGVPRRRRRRNVFELF